MKRTNKILTGTFIASLILFVIATAESSTKAIITPLSQMAIAVDSPDVVLPFPIEDREGDFITEPNENPFYFNDPPNIVKTVRYDPLTGMYILEEKIGNFHYRPPTYMTYAQYLAYTLKNDVKDYWDEREDAKNLLKQDEGWTFEPKWEGEEKFKFPTIEIKPQGNIELTFGTNFQKIDNPTLTEQQRKQGGFDFDMNINMNVIGKIGDIVQLGVKYNTQATFDFQNEVKLEYNGKENDIIRKLEAGNVAMTLPTTLINGGQSLFGVKAELQFGRLTMQHVVSQNKSQQQSITIENGGQVQNFEVTADQYDMNRHYFLSQEFRDGYEQALSQLPIIQSQITIEQVEVWVTNRTGATQNVRDVVAFMDLGEHDPYSDEIQPKGNSRYPDNQANDLYGRANNSTLGRLPYQSIEVFSGPGFNLEPIQDFEKTYAKKLSPSEFSVHNTLGYISLKSALQPNEVLAVAYTYKVNGKTYQVGEFSSQIPSDSLSSQVLYLKMLKSTSIRLELPIWDLMMKNIYPLGAFQLSQEDFFLNVYYQDPGGGELRYLPKGGLKGIPLLEIFELDNLNNQNDPMPDGVFDFVPGTTITPNNGRVIFPVLEPFGDYLEQELIDAGSGNLVPLYVYHELYDSTKIIAQQFPEKNRFVLKGTYKASSGSEISLGAFNIPEGSVQVSVGGQQLVEGRDYTVDYNLGRVKIINEGLLNSGSQVKIDFENNALFGFQIKSLYGSRLDYRVSDKLNIGGTVMKLTERPFTEKVNVGDDPISNSIWGMDVSYNTDAPVITRILDKLPFYSTKESSNLTFYGEAAWLKPGHSKAININEDKGGTVYIDDFEGTSSGYDLKFPFTAWKLASTPRNSPDESGDIMFPEASLPNDLTYGFKRAKLAWYNIDPLYTRNNSATPQYIKDNACDFITQYTREVTQQEVFPNRQADVFESTLLTFDLAYYPRERGPYNYTTTGINNRDRFITGKDKWGGVMRSIDQNDFEAANIEFIEFWVLDPYIDNPAGADGTLYINLGNISEDVLRDSRLLYENGLKSNPNEMDSTIWGQVPRIAPITTAFDNEPDSRVFQDVGFDGLTDSLERRRFNDFIQDLTPLVDNDVLAAKIIDPSSDNFLFHRNTTYDDAEAPILSRYKLINSPDGNSPITNNNQTFSEAATNLPDSEDLNRDNTLNENEEYFQYRVPIFPGMDASNHPYIFSVEGPKTVEDQINDCTFPNTRWIQFRIPIRDFENRVGNIPDFKSIQFMRMFLTDFADSVVLRFAKLDLVRNQWRTYRLTLEEGNDNNPIDDNEDVFCNVASVNIEENSTRVPVNYILPPGIIREQRIGSQVNQNLLQNEQAISKQVCGLPDGQSRAMFKNITLDMRQYERVRMNIHAESMIGEDEVFDDEAAIFIRFGSDFTDNYYEYEIPLKITPPGNYNGNSEVDQYIVWPLENELALDLREFINLKVERNANGIPVASVYKVKASDWDTTGRTFTIKGNPDLGLVKTVMLGIRNPDQNDPLNPGMDTDDGNEICVEVWFNELRLAGLDEEGGAAAVTSLNMKLADLGNINFSANMHGIGFGQLEQKVDQRYRDRYFQYDFSTNLELGKFLPKNSGIRIPFFAQISQSFSTPQYDPYKLDIPLKELLDATSALLGSDSAYSYKRTVQDIVTRKSVNFTGVRKTRTNSERAPRIYDIENFVFSYAFTSIERSSPFTKSDLLNTHYASIGWNHSMQPKYLYPFKKAIKGKSKYWDLIKEINFNPFPSNIGFNTDLNRQFGELKLRSLGDEDFPIRPTFNKFMHWNRSFNIRYNPFKSLSLDFSNNTQSRIDEPEGRLDTKDKRQEIWRNFLKGGRPVNYNQSFSANYTIPINKIPILDWTQVRASYTSGYNWVAGPQVFDPNGNFTQNPQGNIASNTQSVRLNGDFNMKNLYNKVPFLKPYNSNNSSLGDKEKNKQKKENVKKAREKIQGNIDKLKDEKDELKEELKEVKADEELTKEEKKVEKKEIKGQIKSTKKQIKDLKKDKRSKAYPADPKIGILLQPLISIKKISVSYTENKSTTLPGFVPTSGIVGRDREFNSPGWDFMFGGQPGYGLFSKDDPTKRDEWLDEGAAKGWFSTDTLLNNYFTQTASSNFDFKATIEPWRDLRVDLTISRVYSQSHTQLFKKISESGNFEHFSPLETGSYTISFVSLGTMFDKIDSEGLSNTYEAFESNRPIVAERYHDMNPNSVDQGFINPRDSTFFSEYFEGYGPYSQEVLLTSFVAAYQGKDPSTMKLNIFNKVPLPNWRITYNGLSKFSWAKKIFSNFQITHGYTSSLTINSFNSDPFYEGADGFSPSVIDSLNGNYHPIYRIPNVIISEQLSPLIGLDMTMKNGLTAKFDFRKTRTLTMSFVDNQLIENKSTTITIGAGYKLKGLTLPFKWKGEPVRLHNDITFRFDFSFRDNVTVNHRLDQNIAEPTSGSKTITVSPYIEYVASKQLSIRIFFDRTRTIPKTSAAFPITSTNAGVTIRFSLAN